MTRRIAVIASFIHPILQKHLWEWYEDMAIENSGLQLFLGSKAKHLPTAKNYKVNSKPEKLKYWLLNLLHFKTTAAAKRKIRPLVLYDPNIIHLLTSNVFQNIEPLLEDRDIQLIVSFRGYDVNVFPFQSEENMQLTQRIFKRATILHFISDDLKRVAIEMGAEPKKCVVIYRSVRIDTQTDFKFKREAKYKVIILSVGRLVWEKGYLYALETIAILKNKGYNFEYQIAGPGTDLDMLLYHIERLGLRDCVKFLGKLSPQEVKEKLAGANIYFQPSLTEALSLAIIEASYYKLPIVSSNVGGIPEVVENNVTGFLSEPCNSLIYADNIMKLINDPDLRIEMGEKGHQRISKYFSRRKEIEKWKELYQNLMNKTIV